jgi:hypothetical protein
MGGKFRVKVGRRPLDCRARQFCAGTAVESIGPALFVIVEKRSSPPETLFAWQIGCETRQ